MTIATHPPRGSTIPAIDISGLAEIDALAAQAK